VRAAIGVSWQQYAEMPQDLCRALAWEHAAACEQASRSIIGKAKAPITAELQAARTAYLRTYWEIAHALAPPDAAL